MTQEIDLYQKRGSLSEKVLEGLGGARPPIISLKDDRFTFVDEAGNKEPHDGLKLKVIIIGVNENGESRIYWGRKYDEGNEDQMPKCFSDNGIGPSNQSREPQHMTCKGCWASEWGSGISQMTGKPIPACQARKKLAVIIPDHIPEGEQGESVQQVWQLSVPPKSFGALSAYIKFLGTRTINKRKVEAYDVVTELYMENKELQFKAVASPEAKDKQVIMWAWDNARDKEVVGNDDTPVTDSKRIQSAHPQAQEHKDTIKLNGPAVVEAKALFDQSRDETPTPQPRGRGRPPGATNKPKAEVDDVPAFLRAKDAQGQPSTQARSGIVAEPEEVPDGLGNEIEKAFKLQGI